jgi:SAM-dependent methyltransferase
MPRRLTVAAPPRPEPRQERLRSVKEVPQRRAHPWKAPWKLRLDATRAFRAFCASRRSVPCVDAAAESLPFEDQSFDAAMAFATIDHWQDPIAGLREMRRVARRVVVFTCDASDPDRFWLNRDYLPEYAGLWAGRPSLTELASHLADVVSIATGPRQHQQPVLGATPLQDPTELPARHQDPLLPPHPDRRLPQPRHRCRRRRVVAGTTYQHQRWLTTSYN